MTDAHFNVPPLSDRFVRELHDEGGAAVLLLLRSALNDDQSARDRVTNEAYERAWERLHGGDWKDVHPVWREAFGIAAVLKARTQAMQAHWEDTLKTLDMCLMMAGPLAPSSVHRMIDYVEKRLQAVSTVERDNDQESRRAKRQRLDAPLAAKTLHSQHSIPRIPMPSLQQFRDCYMLINSPVIITGGMDHWPAMGTERSWEDLSYIRRVCGHRTVPIEIGSSYLEDDWGQQLMTVNAFIDRFLEPSSPRSSREIGYLAQHHLFEQIPALARDIMTPDYCTIRRSEEAEGEDNLDVDDEDLAVNAWFGPEGTVSPLHFDPKDNLLCQVVGAKYVRLYAPSESEKLYPVEGLLSNTSQVDVENPDLEAFPLFIDASYQDAVLQAGEMLYLPPRHWHFIRSLSTSFSVSFWWS
ncbi:hypothetical protein PINS_up010465 [Pythium insidiosum]|nr:hypothetical protein PINS_up010465 [Pythium insidiosum]